MLIGGDTRLVLRLAGAGRRADPFTFALDRALARFFLFFFLGEALLLLSEPAGIITLIRDAPATIQLENPARDIVEEIAVMGYRNTVPS